MTTTDPSIYDSIMKFFFFHLMSWPYLPDDFDRTNDSAWVWVPNTLFDPAKGPALYADYLNTLAYAEELGFDGVCVNEHHQTAYGLMPSPNLIAAALTQRTKTCKIAVVGNTLPLYDPPQRVAEEFALLDNLSGGRLIAGTVVGGGPEYFAFQIDPTTAREKFREALDLIVKAWTTPGPFEWNSKHYYYRYVNPWPRPVQQPHPPIWIPDVGSKETVEFVAQRRYCYMGVPYFHIDVFRRVFAQFREACQKAGYTADPEQMGLGHSDLRRRDRRPGPRRIRAASVVLREKPAQRHQPGPTRLHVAEVVARLAATAEEVPRRACSRSSVDRRRFGKS